MIKVKKSKTHGRGLFATQIIPKGTHIGTYEGPRTQRDGSYVLWIENEDGTSEGIKGTNALRFVNHSSRPNADFYGADLIAIRKIQPDEEITFHYGSDWRDVD
jgi:SET domain-containing protein